jgi:hypothetical protein
MVGDAAGVTQPERRNALTLIAPYGPTVLATSMQRRTPIPLQTSASKHDKSFPAAALPMLPALAYSDPQGAAELPPSGTKNNKKQISIASRPPAFVDTAS